MSSLFRRKAPLTSKAPRNQAFSIAQPTKAPTAPSKSASVPPTRKTADAPNPQPATPPGGAGKPSMIKSGGSLLATAGTVGAVSLIPSFLNGPRSTGGGGSGGLVGDLLGAGTTLGSTALIADAAKTLGSDAIRAIGDIFKSPVNLAIIAAVVGGVIVISRR